MAGARPAGIHDHRAGAAKWLRLGTHAGKFEKLAVEIEFILRPGPLDYIDPLLSKFVPIRMLPLRDPEHRKFTFVPASDNVQSEAAFPNVVGGDKFFGGDKRVE